MKHMGYLVGGILLVINTHSIGQPEGFKSIFDGVSLSGWEGNENQFRIANGAIVAGDLSLIIELDEFLCTVEEYADFDLLIDAKITGNQIPGVSFRGKRVPNSTQVGGYQADMGFIPGEIIPLLSGKSDVDITKPYPLWGSLLDEYRPDQSRYPDPNSPYRLLAMAEKNIVENILIPAGWNQLRINAKGPNIEILLNGTTTITYEETQAVPAFGHICLQIHSGTPALVEYKNIYIRKLDG